jgi:preprotein translocase subunit SecD
MFRAGLCLLLALLACGCSNDAPKGEFAIYDWEAQRASSSDRGAIELECRTNTCPEPGTEKVYVADMPALTNEDIARDTAQAVEAAKPVVVVQFTQAGQARFERLTRMLARRGAQRGAPQHALLVVDDVVYAAPFIDFERNPDGIPGDNGLQFDVASMSEARDLAKALR